MTELKECPFCGGEYAQVRYMGGKWQEPSAFDSGYRGECCDCGVITAAYDSEAEAIEAWNTRAERTCHNVTDRGFYAFMCSECGYTEEQGTPDYCAGCGAKVKHD